MPETDTRASTISATAYFHPAGVWGMLYWLALKSIHRRIFERFAVRLAERAEVMARQEGD